MKTKLLCLEGIIGAGKTKQASIIREFLLSRGEGVLIVNEKQYEPFKQTVIDWHNSGANLKFSYEEILKFAKARVETHKRHFEPLIGKLDYIIFDRSFYTSGVYQASDNISVEDIININLKEGAIKLDKGAVLACSVDTALRRIEERRLQRDTYNLPSMNETYEEIRGRRELYLQLVSMHKELNLVNSEREESEIFSEIKDLFKL